MSNAVMKITVALTMIQYYSKKDNHFLNKLPAGNTD